MSMLVGVMAMALAASPSDVFGGNIYTLVVEYENNKCVVALNGEPVATNKLLRQLKALPDKKAQMQVIAANGTPYQCVNNAVSSAQKAGFNRVGLISAAGAH